MFQRAESDYVILYLSSILFRLAGINERIIVSSRNYSKSTKSCSFDGIKIGVKDNTDIPGHKIILCNRAWEKIFKQNATRGYDYAKKKSLKAIGFAAPLNPRGNEYQVTSKSSQEIFRCSAGLLELIFILSYFFHLVNSFSCQSKFSSPQITFQF